jgi:hypothetical protein
MFKPSLVSLCLACLLGSPAIALEYDQIDRTIQRQPDYRTQPKYALLVFGKEAKSRVWLVLDGSVLYVDRNANGDLTELDERFLPNACCGAVASYRVPGITESNRVGHTGLNFVLLAHDEFRLSLMVRDEVHQFVGDGGVEKPTLDPDPRSAPAIHFDGPLTLWTHGRASSFVTDAQGVRHSSLRMLLGTPGWGEGTFAAVRTTVRPDNGTLRDREDYRIDLARPRYVMTCKQVPIELEYASSASGERVRSVLTCEISTAYSLFINGRFPLPVDVASGVVRATFGDLHGDRGQLKPSSLEILVP